MYSTVGAIAVTNHVIITCNQMVQCLIENKHLKLFLHARKFFLKLNYEKKRRHAIWEGGSGFFLQSSGSSASNLVRFRESLCQTPKHDRIIMFTDWTLFICKSGSGSGHPLPDFH